jgi:hypothetical protein
MHGRARCGCIGSRRHTHHLHAIVACRNMLPCFQPVGRRVPSCAIAHARALFQQLHYVPNCPWSLHVVRRLGTHVLLVTVPGRRLPHRNPYRSSRAPHTLNTQACGNKPKRDGGHVAHPHHTRMRTEPCNVVGRASTPLHWRATPHVRRQHRAAPMQRSTAAVGASRAPNPTQPLGAPHTSRPSAWTSTPPPGALPLRACCGCCRRPARQLPTPMQPQGLSWLLPREATGPLGYCRTEVRMPSRWRGHMPGRGRAGTRRDEARRTRPAAGPLHPWQTGPPQVHTACGPAPTAGYAALLPHRRRRLQGYCRPTTAGSKSGSQNE